MFTKPMINNGIYDEFPNGWRDPNSFLNILETGMQPVRASYVRDCLKGRNLDTSRFLDIGCGGGIITEDLATLSRNVAGIDASIASLKAAEVHARSKGLDINYQQAQAEDLPFSKASFDVVTCCDVLEHVDDVSAVISEICRVLKPGGVFIYDTVNRTVMSYLSTILIAQDIPWTRIAPKNAHVWHKFIRPNELISIFEATDLRPCHQVGIGPSVSPLTMLWYILQLKRNEIDYAAFGSKIEFKMTRSKAISYLGHCIKGKRIKYE